MTIEDEGPAPPILWKYRQWNEHTETMIVCSELYFAPLGQLNDPMDCHWREKFPEDRIAQFTLAKEMCNKWATTLTHSERIEALTELIKYFRQSIANATEGNLWNSAKHGLGVLCLSEVNNDFLMWSHYSAGHKGICVGIKSDKIEKPLMQCKYSDDPPFIYGWDYVWPNTGVFAHAARCKALRWAYEREWRTVGKTGPVQYNGCVDSVVLGVSVDEEIKKQILDAVKQSGQPIKILQAKRHPSEYKLIIEPIAE